MLGAVYYGKGICHWDFGGVSVSLKATGARGEANFMLRLDKKDFFAFEPMAVFLIWWVS